jgi:hypothetical protein
MRWGVGTLFTYQYDDNWPQIGATKSFPDPFITFPCFYDENFYIELVEKDRMVDDRT